LYNQIIAIAYF